MNPFITIKELKEKLARKEINQKEILDFYTQRIKKYNSKLNCVIETFTDNLNNTNSQIGALSGIPFIAKDNICQNGRIASAGSKILSNYKAPYDATVISKLKEAGAIPLGRGNCDEFAMGASGEYSNYGVTNNPWDITRTPGGSSAGPAAAVSAGLVPFAIGTETGGSVRQPASFCNLVGLYPTYGRNSRYGLIAFASSTDQAGPITRTVYDNALVASILSGQDKHDSTTLQLPAQDYTKDLDGKLPDNFTLGVIKDSLNPDGIDPQIIDSFTKAISHLEKMGAKIKYIDIPMLKYGVAIYFIISRAEGASNLSRYDGTLYGHRAQESTQLHDMYIKTRQEGFGQEVKIRILTGNYVLSSGYKDAYYNKALQARNILRAEFEKAFQEVTLLTSPTVSMLPFKLGQFVGDALTMFLADCFTVPQCVIGTPGLSLPCGLSRERLPIGIQFLGPRLSEMLIYKVAYAYEQSTGHYLNNPAGYD
jgi:aspartyl-tRNA(Asn)/glutamyl-tRNA(Gln) amidotransferase subunit A